MILPKNIFCVILISDEDQQEDLSLSMIVSQISSQVGSWEYLTHNQDKSKYFGDM